MEGFLRADASSAVFSGSPSNSFLAEDVASTCNLINPSPPTNALVNPAPEPVEDEYNIGDELAEKLSKVRENVDSASTSSSNSAEPVCTQLLNHKDNGYRHVIKDEQNSAQETNGKVQPVQLTFRNPPDNYFFMSWNWPLIRKLSLWLFLSGLVAMVGLVIAMISMLPTKCNPGSRWYQGSVLYEIFPASFADSNGDMIGDFKGIAERVDYLKALGVGGVRLNSIFATPNYPEDYRNFSSLTEIATPLGTAEDFKMLTGKLDSKNISIVLDIHVAKVLPSHLAFKSLKKDDIKQDIVGEALSHWTQLGVDGFYLKDLELYMDNPTLIVDFVEKWKRIVGKRRPLIVSHSVVEALPKHLLYILLSNIDLVDIKLNIEAGADMVTQQITSTLNSTLFENPSMPWVHWSLSNEDSVRLTNRLPMGNATVGATLLQLMLPGTPCIFYGDEIALQQVFDPEGERSDLKHMHQFVVMEWEDRKFSKSKVLPWMHGESTQKNFEQVKTISKMIALRKESPAIYMNAVVKDGDNKASAQVKYSQMDLLVIQRWYPRRKSYVIVSNLGSALISSDLSKLLYSGTVIVGPKPDSQSETISFNSVSLWPGESVVVALD